MDKKKGRSKHPPGRDDATVRRLADLLGGDAPAPGPTPDAAEGSGIPQEGPLRLDKTGALVGRPKREPVKAYADPERERALAQAREKAPKADAPPKAEIPPPIGGLHASVHAPAAAEDDEVTIAAGRFLSGERLEPKELPAFRIDRFPVTHAAYATFVAATGHRPPLYWPGGVMPEDLASHPVVGVDYYDALAYARWRGKDLPFEDEWERAARGTAGATYPWGDDSTGEANTGRLGLKMTLPNGWHATNMSPEGVRDMVGNVWEITHSPAPGGGIVVRGGSWYDFALYAKTWFRFASLPEARNGTIGFRCVRREGERDAPREVPAADAARAIEARRGAQVLVAADEERDFSPERRDLVPDIRRLKNMVAEHEVEVAAAPPPRETPRRTSRVRPAVKAAVPPPLRVAPPEGPDPSPSRTPPPAPVSPPAEGAAPDLTADADPAPRQRLWRRVPRAEEAGAMGPAAPGGRQGVRGWRDVRVTRGLQAAGLLLVAVLLGVLVVNVLGSRGGREGTATARRPASPPAASRLPSALERLPPARPGDPRDEAPPTWWTRGPTRELSTGTWLVVFGGGAEIDASTVSAAAEAHRRLRDRGVAVLLVLPRERFETPERELPDEAVRGQYVAGLGARTDLRILLDPFAGPGLRSHLGLTAPTVAIVMRDGRVQYQTTPWQGGFTLEDLAPLALEALRAE